MPPEAPVRSTRLPRSPVSMRRRLLSSRRRLRFDSIMELMETDAQLVARCRAGDEDAWRELVDRFSRYVYAIIVQAFRLPEHDAEDVFQEVFTRAYTNLDKLRDDDAIRPWLAQLTRRLCIDSLRAGAREQPGDEALEEPVDAVDTISRLDEALAVHE